MLLGCGAKLGLQLWEEAAARAEDVCSLHVLTPQRGTARIWFRVCRSGFHYTTVLVTALDLVGCSWWGGLLSLGESLCDQMNRKEQDFCCSTVWVLMEGWSGIASTCEMWETYQKRILQTMDWKKNNNFLQYCVFPRQR